MASRHPNQPRSPRLRATFWRKIKGVFASRSLPTINCEATRVLLGTPSTPCPDKDEPPTSPISPISPIFSDVAHTSPNDPPKSPKVPPVERAWYTEASLSSSFAKEQSVRENATSSPNSSLETVRAGGLQHTSTLRAISTPYLFPFPSTEPTARPNRSTGRISTGQIWEQVAEVGSQDGNHSG